MYSVRQGCAHLESQALVSLLDHEVLKQVDQDRSKGHHKVSLPSGLVRGHK